MSYQNHTANKPGQFRRNRNDRPFKSNNKRGRTSKYIDPKKFIKAATAAQQSPEVIKHKFTDFALDELLQRNLSAKGYVTPSPIQDLAIPLGIEQKDVIGIASTGTGKTAAFALPVLQRLIVERNSAAIIIAPTRELAQQIEVECQKFATGSHLVSALLIGGAGMGYQLRALRARPRIVIGTPGRIKDHLKRGTLRLEKFNMVVLDEVDRMLDMGFVDDVTEILAQINPQRQSFFFSATMDARVRKLIENFTNNPVTVSVKASSASENVDQNVIRFATSNDKLEKLHNVLIQENVSRVIVFDDTQRSVDKLYKELTVRGFSAESMHGGKSQGQRQRALAKFKNNEIKILVATDVAARGIDVNDISHVINYSVPRTYDDYIHRIGRAGRAGKSGNALTFISS